MGEKPPKNLPEAPTEKPEIANKPVSTFNKKSLFVCPSVHLSICPSVCLSVCLSVRLLSFLFYRTDGRMDGRRDGHPALTGLFAISGFSVGASGSLFGGF